MKTIRYDVIKNDKIIKDFDTKNEAINYAIKNNCDLIVKFDDFNFEPLGVVWEKEE